jgi:cytochrome c-type biogenesis protein CcmE
VRNHEAPSENYFRLGGLVEAGSIVRRPDSMTIEFKITDTNQAIIVEYNGILPDLFREGQGVIGFGRMQGDTLFVADEILAKHDENYMPPEVKAAINQKHAAQDYPI